MEEVWKDITGYEGAYQVSTLGRVRSLDRIALDGRNVKGVILKQNKTGIGYLGVGLHKNGKQRTKKVHQLVAVTFLNHKPCGFNGLIVDHIDNNPLNNKLSNLQLTTNRHNVSKDKNDYTSKYTGVSWDKTNNKWRSAIIIDGKYNLLGRFHCELKAHLVYQNKLKEL